MSSANRQAEISEHLEFIGSENANNLGRKLTRQFMRAHATLTKQSTLPKIYRKQTLLSDEAVNRWYSAYELRKASLQPDLTLSAVERARLTLIDANDNAQYWIQLMRNHEHHNYKTRVTVSDHIANECRKRSDALKTYNLARKNHDHPCTPLSIKDCQERGLLHRLRGDMASPDYAKHQYYDCLQVKERAKEELAYTTIEVMSLLAYHVSSIQRHKALMEAVCNSDDNSTINMHASICQHKRFELGRTLKEMKIVTDFMNLDIEIETKLAADTAVEVPSWTDTADVLPIGEVPHVNSEDENDVLDLNEESDADSAEGSQE